MLFLLLRLLTFHLLLFWGGCFGFVFVCFCFCFASDTPKKPFSPQFLPPQTPFFIILIFQCFCPLSLWSFFLLLFLPSSSSDLSHFSCSYSSFVYLLSSRSLASSVFFFGNCQFLFKQFFFFGLGQSYVLPFAVWCFFCFVLALLVLVVDVVLKPSLFFGEVSFVYLLFLFCFFWGFKAQVRWPEGPPHLALNPPYLFLFDLFCLFVRFAIFFVLFVLLAKDTENAFRLKTGHFAGLLSVCLAFILSSPFLSLFLSFFFSFFLSFFAFSFLSLLPSFLCFMLSFLYLFCFSCLLEQR